MRALMIGAALVALGCGEANPAHDDSAADDGAAALDESPLCDVPDIATTCSDGSAPRAWGDVGDVWGYDCPTANVTFYFWSEGATDILHERGPIRTMCDDFGQRWSADTDRRCILYCRAQVGRQCRALDSPEWVRCP